MNAEAGETGWTEKGATLSDKSARKEFGLTQPEIIQAIREGKLQFRENDIYGNPFFRLIRSEVETLVAEKYGGNYLKQKKLLHELAQVTKALKKLKTQTVVLAKRKDELSRMLDE
jgi:hypothetical protein